MFLVHNRVKLLKIDVIAQQCELLKAYLLSWGFAEWSHYDRRRTHECTYLSLSYNINVSSVRTRISFPVCIAYLSKLQKISVDSMTLSYLSCLNITFINIVVLPWIFKRQTVPSLNNNEKFYEYLWRISLDTPFNVTIYNRKLPEILQITHKGNTQFFILYSNFWSKNLW